MVGSGYVAAFVALLFVVFCSALQYVAARCRVLQCVAVFCNVECGVWLINKSGVFLAIHIRMGHSVHRSALQWIVHGLKLASYIQIDHASYIRMRRVTCMNESRHV